MLLGIATLLIAIVISTVSAYYSVLGLTAIFAAAFWPIVLMGGALETGKIMTAVWLHRNWKRASTAYKLYLVPALAFLMLLTSMGIFGFLSKAHIDQAVPTGDVAAQVSLIDEKIKIERDNIENARQVIKQMDAAVNGVIATGDQEIKLRDGSTQVKSAAERSLQIRRSQAKDRATLTKQIDEAQGRIVKLQEEKAPIAANLRKVEAEVGPIKYVAALIYGDNPDQALLEKAVRWVIILIVLVFDPLAVVLILAGTKQIEWAKGINYEVEDHHKELLRQLEIQKEEDGLKTQIAEPEVADGKVETQDWADEDFDKVANDLLAEIEKEEQNTDQVADDANKIQQQEQLVENLVREKQELESKFEKDLSDAVEIISILEENSNKSKEKIDSLSNENVSLHVVVNELSDRNSLLETEVHNLLEQLEKASQVKNTPSISDFVPQPQTLVVEPEPVPEEVQPEPVSVALDLEPVDFAATTTLIAPVTEEKTIPSFTSLVADNADSAMANASFGTKFPDRSNKGDLFLRVDYLPSKLFKWNGNKWIEVDKTLTDSYTYNDQYLQHLISRLEKGEYDIDDLSDNERSQIDDFLNRKNNAQ